MKFFVKTVAWSLLGTKDWKNSKELQQVSLVNKLTKNFRQPISQMAMPILSRIKESLLIRSFKS